MPDEFAQPEDEGYGLVVPFVVCTSKGGPYDDEAFVAGFQAGSIDRALTVAAAAGADRVPCTVRTTLVRQLELLAMHRGFPVMTAEAWEPHPEWSFVVFSKTGEAAEGSADIA